MKLTILTFLTILSISITASKYRVELNHIPKNLVPQKENRYIKSERGTTLLPSIFSNNIDSKFILRRRFGAESYVLFLGKASNRVSSKNSNLIKFPIPTFISHNEAIKSKFYSSSHKNQNQDIKDIYFDSKNIYAENYANLYVFIGKRWVKISSIKESIKKIEKNGTLGDILIKSTPKGGDIFLDGKKTGVITPNYLTDIKVGKHLITIKKPYYITEKRVVNVSAKEISELSVNLRSSMGSIAVFGKPIGAKIRLNGKPVGNIPDTINDLMPGKYRISIEELYHKRKAYVISVKEGEITKISTNLDPQFGTIILPELTNKNHTWIIDGKKVINSKVRLNSGQHRILFDGGVNFQGIDTIITLAKGEIVTPKFSITEIKSTIQVMAIPTDANIYIDNEYISKGYTTKDIKVGKHTVKVSKAGYKSKKITLDFKLGEKKRVRFNLIKEDIKEKVAVKSVTKKKIPKKYRPKKKNITKKVTKKSKYGYFSFASSKPLAKIYENDSLIGYTSKGKIRFKNGVHILKFVSSDNEEVTKRIFVNNKTSGAVYIQF